MLVPSAQTLRRALILAEKIEQLQAELSGLVGQASGAANAGVASFATAGEAAPARKKPNFSKAARARIAAAQKARWARVKAGKPSKVAAAKSEARAKGAMSVAGRANIVKAQKARWAKVKAEKAKKG
jgi:hypothetical protein